MVAACNSAPVPSRSSTPAANPSIALAGSPSASGSTASPATPAGSITNTTGWKTQAMAGLGYRIDLPPDFERVTDDPQHPVPSIAAIAQRDPDQAANLQVVATRLQANAGLFGDLGLWAIQPSSLLQIGVLAGLPYRIAAADLRTQVEQAVAARASPLEASSIDVIELPAGTGFLAGYRNGTDLSLHREVHLRTPNGRYLVIVMTLTGIMDPATEIEFLAIAGSLTPLPGAASGDTPAPATGPEGHADAALEALLPDSVGAVALEKRSVNGEDLVGSGTQTGGTVIDALGSIVAAPGAVSVALAVPSASGSTRLLLAAYRAVGVDEAKLGQMLAGFPAQVWSHQTIGGRDVLVSVAGSDKSRTYLRIAGDVLEQVETDDAALAQEAIAALG